MITFITGGARSGKSSFAQREAEKLTDSPIYIATARIWDDDFRERVDRHIAERDQNWTTFEKEKGLKELPLTGRVAVIDCVTLWLTNLFMDTDKDIDKSLKIFCKEIDELYAMDCRLFIISNEIGMGTHAHNESARKFTDLQGWANQYVANKADNVIFMISGLPMVVK